MKEALVRRILGLLISAAAATVMVRAQTTQGLIAGHVVDSTSGQSIPAAEVTAASLATNLMVIARTGPSGYYVLPVLPPAVYRLRIIAALVVGEKNVGDLAEAAAISESAVSHHLRDLRQLRIVKTRKEGRFVFYSLDDDHVIDLFHFGLEHVRHG